MRLQCKHNAGKQHSSGAHQPSAAVGCAPGSAACLLLELACAGVQIKRAGVQQFLSAGGCDWLLLPIHHVPACCLKEGAASSCPDYCCLGANVHFLVLTVLGSLQLNSCWLQAGPGAASGASAFCCCCCSVQGTALSSPLAAKRHKRFELYVGSSMCCRVRPDAGVRVQAGSEMFVRTRRDAGAAAIDWDYTCKTPTDMCGLLAAA